MSGLFIFFYFSARKWNCSFSTFYFSAEKRKSFYGRPLINIVCLAERRLEADVWSGTDRAIVADSVAEIEIVVSRFGNCDSSALREGAVTAADVWIAFQRAPDPDEEWKHWPAWNVIIVVDCCHCPRDFHVSINAPADRKHPERYDRSDFCFYTFHLLYFYLWTDL